MEIMMQNGEWTCAHCRGELGAVCSIMEREWAFFMPDNCENVDACEAIMKKMVADILTDRPNQ